MINPKLICDNIENNIKKNIKKNIKIKNNIKKFYVDFETTYIYSDDFSYIENYKSNEMYNTSLNEMSNISLNEMSNTSLNEMSNTSLNEMPNTSLNEMPNTSLNEMPNTSLNEMPNSVFLYMIGVGWIDEDNEWKYKNFTVDILDNKNEKKILNEFYNFINKYPKNILIHWSKAEQIIMKNVLLKYNLTDKKYNFNWFDLHNIYKKNIVIKNCYSFGLKDISKTLYKLNIINDKWIDDDINAIDAIMVPINANKIYKKGIIKSIKVIDNIKDIYKYNEIDCKMLYNLMFSRIK
jgi:hypothetical protein